MHAHAVVFTGRNQVQFLPVECPEPGPADLVIEVWHSWISNGTEGSFLRGERTAGDTTWRPGDPSPFPLIAGYQKVGRVTRVGADVRGLAVGDMVFAVMSQVEGMFDRHAGHVSPSVCRAHFVHKLPDGADPVAYCGLVLAQVGYNCGTRPRLAAGQLAVVIGDGLVGQWAGQTLRARGAHVVITGRHETRLAAFRAGGAGETLLVAAGSGVTELKQLTAAPVHVLVDTVGDTKFYDDYLPVMAHGGTVVSAGFYGTEDQIELQRYRFRELAFDLVAGITRERLDATMEWIRAGRIDTLRLITHRFPVTQAADAWALIESKREHVLGVVLDWPAAGGGRA
jgi:2-desacetyl-2-hydroxyethyl bacteriochlorophyllide A dehydrogenase